MVGQGPMPRMKGGVVIAVADEVCGVFSSTLVSPERVFWPTCGFDISGQGSRSGQFEMI